MKNFGDTIGKRTRVLPACSAVPRLKYFIKLQYTIKTSHPSQNTIKIYCNYWKSNFTAQLLSPLMYAVCCMSASSDMKFSHLSRPWRK